MKHVLPFKQRQIEQRQLEAEADKASRVKTAEGSAQARRIEATGEADARQKLADAESYRLEKIGKVNAEQMAREGALITRHPLLIQKTLADKLSDKVQVIIAPPPADGGFIGATLLGADKQQRSNEMHRLHTRTSLAAPHPPCRAPSRRVRGEGWGEGRMHPLCAALLACALQLGFVAVAAASPGTAIVVRDQTPLRAAPRDSAQQQAVLWQGEAVEVRGERMDYLQVYDHRRERGGFVRASQVRRVARHAARGTRASRHRALPARHAGRRGARHRPRRGVHPGGAGRTLQGESGVEALDALGTFADRLAQRASTSGAVQSKSCGGGAVRAARRSGALRRSASSTFESAKAACRLLRRRCVPPRCLRCPRAPSSGRVPCWP